VSHVLTAVAAAVAAAAVAAAAVAAAAAPADSPGAGLDKAKLLFVLLLTFCVEDVVAPPDVPGNVWVLPAGAGAAAAAAALLLLLL
jgi:hypothetical protein